MKLLELIVKNVNREKIHHDAKYFMQDVTTKDVKFSRLEGKPDFSTYYGKWYRGKVKTSDDNLGYLPLSEDAATTIITREELMRAYDLVEQGYTLWFGGDCPVGDGVIVEVAMKDESLTEVKESESCRWDHYGSNGDIIAYRVNSEKNHDVITEINDKDFSIDIINLISSVAPKISVSDAIEIANSLIDEGYHK